MKKEIKVKLKRVVDDSYPIVIEKGVFGRLGEMVKANHKASSYAIVCDETTKKLFGEALLAKLEEASLKAFLFTIPPGEKAKNQNTKNTLDEAMLKAGCDRKTLLIALGGGVVGDLAGFTASTFMRGIDYIQIPTTLLAMVDSSIGGKTGIDAAAGKNLIGSFWQPKGVYIDLDFLETLPQEQFVNGLFESVKIFATSDKKHFAYLREHLGLILKKDPEALNKVIARSVELKAEVVSGDEREGNERMILNFGHTIGHALEKLSDYSILHGHAVALGMLVEAKISVHLGILPKADFEILKRVILNLGVDPKLLQKCNFDEIVKVTRGDKKNVAGHAKYILLQKIGEVFFQKDEYAHFVPPSEVKGAFSSLFDI